MRTEPGAEKSGAGWGPDAQLRRHLRAGSTHERYVRRVVEEGQVREEDVAEGILVGAYARAVSYLGQCPAVGRLSPEMLDEAVCHGLRYELRARRSC